MNQPTHPIAQFCTKSHQNVPLGGVLTRAKVARFSVGHYLIFPLLIMALNSAAQTCAPAPPGLLSWWAAEGSGNDSVHTNTGTLIGGLTFTNGEVGQAFSFDGVDDYVIVSDSPSLNFGTNQDFSIEAWIRPQASLTTFDVMTIVDKRNAPDPTHGIGYEIALIGGRLECRISDSSADAGTSFGAAGPDLRDGNFHHVAVTLVRNSTNGSHYYVDGVAVLTFNPTAESGDLANGQPLRIGNHPTPGVFANFKGRIDELSIYNRALSTADVQAIYNAGSAGKCLNPASPFIVSQPTNQTVTVGDTATFSVVAGGTPPLSYQWRLAGTNLLGATNNSLTLTNVQLTDAGNYSVVVSNAFGTVTSSNAVLAVNTVPSATLLNVDFAAFGRVKVGFAATGQGSADFWNDYTAPFVSFAGLSNLTRADGVATTVGLTLQNGAGQTIVPHPDLMYQVACYAQDNGDITLTVTNLPGGEYDFYLYGHAGDSTANSVFQLVVGGNDHGNRSTATDASWSLTNWVEGAQYVVFRGVQVTNGGAPVIVKSHPGVSGYTYLNGLQVALTVPTAPSISTQPMSQTVAAGDNVMFSVTANGTNPLGYQWQRSNTNLPGATASFLILTNVQFTDAGNYSVVVSNSYGTIGSSNAVLTVQFPSAVLHVADMLASGGNSLTIPVRFIANGNENALGFSLNYDPSLLTFGQASLGGGISNAFFFPNTNQVANGKVGFAIALPAGNTFVVGTQVVVNVTFAVAPVAGSQNTAILFTDQPTTRQLSDAQANVLAVNYVNGTVSIAATEYEADVSPRSTGDRQLTITDWVQVGRFVAKLDEVNAGSEFQRADCAPKATRGDGNLTVTDWVQAGRYASGLDPLTPAGGSIIAAGDRLQLAKNSPAFTPVGAAEGSSTRVVRILDATVLAGELCSITIHLEGEGNENALGFSLNFDPTVANFVSASLGSGAAGTLLNVNTNFAGMGRIGFVLALPTGSSFNASNREVIKVSVAVSPTAEGASALSFTNQPVSGEISDAEAGVLPAEYINATLTVSPLPGISIHSSGTNVLLSWPVAATNFVLQTNATLTSGSWGNLPITPTISGSEKKVTLPASAGAMFYRLTRP